jgi:archaellum component FlaF (FlaF/FlaG flagellin family)
MIETPSMRLALWLLLGSPAWAQVTQRVNLASDGAQGNSDCFHAFSVTLDGRYVGFTSTASNLVPGDVSGTWDVFVRDRALGTIERVSVDSNGVAGNLNSGGGWLSAAGRYVAFGSNSNLVPNDTNGSSDAFVHDRISGTTERVSVDSGGAQGDGTSYGGPITPDGRYVVFTSFATNLVPGDTNGLPDIFVHDRQSGITERVSVDSNGGQGDGSSDIKIGSITDDGRYVAFESDSGNLVPGDLTKTWDVFVHDRTSGTTECVSVASNGALGNQYSFRPFLSADGRYVAFSSLASNLVPGDTNGYYDVFVRDRVAGTTERVSLSSNGSQAAGASGWPSISADGRFVTFESFAGDLVGGDTNLKEDIFVRDRQSGTTERVSIDSAGVQGTDHSDWAAASVDARFIVFDSEAENLVPDDTNGFKDVFIRDRSGGTAFTSLCDPGTGGVIVCPCANPAGGAGRGCDNSAATGGGALSASGGTYLSSDSLVFTTSGEKPTALSIVAQWTGTNAAGIVFGMGVRCTSGTLERLFTKSASSGSITAPNFGIGDPQVSVRSAALGDPILAGQSRSYLVYYRDPVVLGGCPITSTFNATQTGLVSWSP